MPHNPDRMRQFERSLPMMLYRALDAVLPSFRTIFAKYGITEGQWRVLRVLWESDEKTLSQLAPVTLTDAPALVGVVDRLEKQGLVERERSIEDRRRVHIRLTAAGRRLEGEVRPLVDEAYATIEATVSAGDWNALYQGLDAIAHAHGLVPIGPDGPRPPGDTEPQSLRRDPAPGPSQKLRLAAASSRGGARSRRSMR